MTPGDDVGYGDRRELLVACPPGPEGLGNAGGQAIRAARRPDRIGCGEAALGLVEAGSTPGRRDRTGPALGNTAQAGPVQAPRPVPGDGRLRPGDAPGGDRGEPTRLR